jgi:hypothetical protein
MRHIVSTLLIAVGTLSAPMTAHAIDPVTSCGQFVRGSGILVGDLDCSGTAGDAVNLQGRLHLAGFTLTGHSAHDVVRCLKGACRVDGPGTLSGGVHGVHSDKVAKLIGVTVSNNTGDGVRADKTARVDGASISNNAGDGVHADKVNARSTDFLGNGADGAHAVRKATLHGCNVAGNAGNGVSSDRLAKVTHDTTVSGNGLDGVNAGRIMVKKNASVAANGTSAACGVTEECDDLASDRRPIVGSGASCGTSRDTAGGGSWGVCLGD